ncbi:hypothetical protein RJ639_044669 [Escallonia herrerae]|uniref:J domain-containing protein n=1 Tax=Escallonia herrerae TaxID=1293975 RepID=A0AA88WBS8_9ASTE|nr:hypothetical protein RJ639_044669 [Escallonia herrerae]
MPESELANLTLNGLDLEIRKKFEGMKFRNVFELSSRVTRYETLLKEEQIKKNSLMGTYYQDPIDLEVDAVEMVGKKPVTCDTLVKVKNPISLPSGQPNKLNPLHPLRKYSFDINQADQIVDHLFQIKFIQLQGPLRIPKDKKSKFYREVPPIKIKDDSYQRKAVTDILKYKTDERLDMEVEDKHHHSSENKNPVKQCQYKVLGLGSDCTADEIRSAYRRLALQRHPDKLTQFGISLPPTAGLPSRPIKHLPSHRRHLTPSLPPFPKCLDVSKTQLPCGQQ